MDFGDHMRMCMLEPDFMKKFPSGKNNQESLKMAENRVFRLFKKMKSSAFSGIGTKRKCICSFDILQKHGPRKILVLKLWAKVLLANEI